MTRGLALQISSATVLGVILGAGTLVMGLPFALGGILGAVLLFTALARPELVVLLLLSFGSGLLPEQFNPYIDLLIGRFQASDLILILLLMVVLFRVLADRAFTITRTPLDLPVLLFYGSILLGLCTAVLRFGISFSAASYEARYMMHYLVFFAVTNLIRNRSQAVRLAQGVTVLGMLTAIAMLTQSSLFPSIAPTPNLTMQEGGVVRVFHPGITLVYLGLYVVLSHLALSETERYLPIRWMQVLVMGAALYVTVTRNLFVSLVLGVVLLLAVVTRYGRSRLVRNIAVIVGVVPALAGLLVIVGGESGLAEYAVALYGRLGRMFSADIFAPGESLAYRWAELRYSWAHISQHPILGIGLYSPYRPPFYPGEPIGLQRYIHNAYISLWLKTGIVGLSSFLWLSIAFVQRGVRKWRDLNDGFLRSVMLGLCVAYVGMMLSNLVAPSMVQPGSLVIFGVAFGLNEVIILYGGSPQKHHPSSPSTAP